MRRSWAVALGFAASPHAAQSPVYQTTRGNAGIELRAFRFDSGIELRQAWQLSVPFALGRPIGRRTFVDATTHIASTILTAHDGSRQRVSGLTDTQLRASVTASPALTLSFGVNLPSGVSQVATDQLSVVRSAAQNFLPFPVSSHGAGFGMAGGAVYARQLGDWSVGLAGSVRYISTYRPVSDSLGDYSPGAEVKLRLGFERLLGERISLSGGVTYTSFGTDEFTGVPAFVYRPGDRYIGELVLSRQWGRTRASTYAWVYWRSSGDSAGAVVPQARERIAHGGIVASRRLTPAVEVTGAVEGRYWSAAAPAYGRLVGIRATAAWRLSRVVSLSASGRFETGHIWLELGDAGLSGSGISFYAITVY